MKTVFISTTLLLVMLGSATEVARADEDPFASKIRDNLFLLEEAYNQEAGVIQHIQVLQVDPRTGDVAYAFTEEWPVPDETHQLSLTLPVLAEPADDFVGVGDVALNYRLQAVSVTHTGWLAVAPRLSIVLPTGSYANDAGRGAIGLQLGVPASLDLGRWLTLHLNAGLMLTPSARAPDGDAATAVDASAGAALVVLPLSWLNVFVEALWMSREELADGSSGARRERTNEVVVSPSVRFAIGRAGGLQVVPGVAATVTVLPESRFVATAYLSLEHPAF